MKQTLIFFAVFCGFSFASLIYSISLKVWGGSNMHLVYKSVPNMILIPTLFVLLILVTSCTHQEIEKTYLSFQSSGYELHGTMTTPYGKGPFPLALLVHGSGSLNRDSEIALVNEDQHCIYPGLKNDTLRLFKDLADQLSNRGLAVFSYDKRNYTYSTLNNDPDFTPYDLIEDVHAAIDFIKTRSKVDTNKIILIGHSQGANLIPIVANDRNDIKALIGLATAAQRIDTLIGLQLHSVKEKCPNLEYLNEYDGIIKGLKLLKKDSLPSHHPFLGWYPNYWRDWKEVTAETIQNYRSSTFPTLFLQGTDDFNVPAYNGKILEHSLPPDSFKVTYLNGLNHFFASDSNPRMKERVSDTIVNWLEDL